MKKERYFNAIEFKDIKSIIYNSAKQYAQNIAFTIKYKNDKDVTYENITFKRLLQDINAFGTKLYEMGFKSKRIAVVGRNRYEWVVAHLSNLLGGIVSVPLDKELQVDELENCLERSKADVVVFDEKYIENIEEIKKRGNTKLQKYICMSEQEGYENFWDLKKQGEKLLKQGQREYTKAKVDENKMSILLFTSGTTSKSKAVMLSQNNIASNVYSMLLVEDLQPTDINLAFLPYHHIFGSTCMVVMLAAGIKTAFPDGLRYVAQNLKEYKVSVFVGVPLLVEAIYKNVEKQIEKQGKTKLINIAKKVSNVLRKCHIDIRRKLFKQVIEGLGGHLRFVISGGAPLDKKVAQGFDELGVQVAQGYGLTETAPVIAAENYKKKRYGSVGIPLENVEVEIVNQDANGIGEVRAKGPNVMLGYYENEEATNEVLVDGWFHTGDLGYMDKDGIIFIAGRKKNVIVLKNGKNIYPEELELLINNLPYVAESMVFGMPKGDDLVVSVKIVYNESYVKEKYNGVSEDELKDIIWKDIKEINSGLTNYKHIKNLIITNEPMVKTTTAKVKRFEEMKKIKE